MLAARPVIESSGLIWPVTCGHPTHCQCFWRCPVTTCPMWFSSELNGKDHLERIHSFREGLGYSFYDCLRQFGMAWFGRRTFFEEREVTGQALWMDLALARRSGQELRNNYVITNSPALAPLRRFFCAAVRSLVVTYEDLASSRVTPVTPPSICEQMRLDIAASPPEYIHSPVADPGGGHTSGGVLVSTDHLLCLTMAG